MKRGVLQQVAKPQYLYDHPDNLFVAGFIGSPAMNLVQGILRNADDGPRLRIGSQELSLDEHVFRARPALHAYLDRAVVVGIRPEDMEDATLAPHSTEGQLLRSRADLVEAMGSELLVHFGLDAAPVVTEDTKELAKDAGTDVLGQLDAAHTDMIGRFSPRSHIRENDQVTVLVDTDHLHFFDPVTGLALWDAS
jgi:multiple sugar transport system ATP-binding protein